MAIRIIGLGGIGSHLVSPLCRHIDAATPSAKKPKDTIILIDGDTYEAKNANRQEFMDIGNKAEISAQRIKRDFPTLNVEVKPHFVSEENVFLFVDNGDTVFLCVDNHATRKLLSDRCQQLENAILISGGNEITDGNVQIYVRRKSKDLTPPLTYLHPEIESPKDRNPAEMSCEELALAGTPQLIFTNLTAAVQMLAAFWMVSEFLEGRGELKYSEVCFDLVTGMAQSYLRKEESGCTTRKRRK